MTLSDETVNPFNTVETNKIRWISSIDSDNTNKFRKSFILYKSNKAFFKEFQQKNKLPGNMQFFLEFDDFQLIFYLNSVNFLFKLKEPSKSILDLDYEVLTKTKSPYILNPVFEKNSQEIYYPFHFGTTLERIIQKNKKNHILEESDKILLSIQVTKAIRDLYEQNANNDKYSHRKISDRSFFIDYKKNAYLFSISDDKINNSFEINNIEDQKARDIRTIKLLLEEIFKEINPNDELRSNQSHVWYSNNHEALNNILNKEYNDFNSIITDLENLKFISKQARDWIDYEKKNPQTLLSTEYSFFESILSKFTINLDIESIYRQLFTQLRNKTKEGDQYYLFFNLILHIFFPTFNANCHSLDMIKFLEIFDGTKEVSSLIKYNLLVEYLPANEEIINAIENLKKDFGKNTSNQEIENESILSNKDIELILDILKANKLSSIIISEFREPSQNQTFLNFLKKIYFHYYPGNEIECQKIENNCVIDYFGILKFLMQKNDLIYITHPSISNEDLNRLKNVPSDKKINRFLNSEFPDSKYNDPTNITQSLEGFDFLNVTHKVDFKFEDSTFWIERRFKHENKNYKKRVYLQDEIFTKIQSKKDEYEKKQLQTKYILQLDKEANKVDNGEISSVSNIPLFSCTLNQFIQRNSQNRIIQDSDKILWAIQIASAFAVLEKFEEDEFKEKWLFSKSIFDQFFYIDSMKNIYLCALAFCFESEKDSSTSNGPMYFRCENDNSYVYKYGVLLFEIFAEFEPKYLFGNLPRKDRLEVLEKGYEWIELFNKYKEDFSNVYGAEIGQIVDRCISIGRNDKYQNFQQIISDLKKTNLYNKYKYSIDIREKAAKPIDSKYNCSFKSLLLSSVTKLRDIKPIMKGLFDSCYNLCDNTNLKSDLENSLNIINDAKSSSSYFGAINNIFKISYVDSMLSEIISRKFYQSNGNKAIVINESIIKDLASGLENLTYFDFISRRSNEGITVEDSSSEHFFPNKTELNRCHGQKVPLMSIDNLKKDSNYNYHVKRWIYQIIYFLNKKGYIPSTKSFSYEIDLNDFDLFYNNKTKLLDVDVSLKSIYEINKTNKINVFSFARLLKELKKYIKEDDILEDDLDDDDEFESIDEFISYCNELSKKGSYYIEFCSNFESRLNNGSFFYDLLKLYEKELEKIVSKDNFEKIVNGENYQDKNYEINYSNIKEYISDLQEVSKNPTKIVKNKEDRGFYCFYSINEPNKTSNDDAAILNHIFPSVDVDVTKILEQKSSITEAAKDLLMNNQIFDEIADHHNKNDDVKLFLIMKALPEVDPIHIYKVFQLKNKRIYDTLAFFLPNNNNSTLNNENPKPYNERPINYKEYRDEMDRGSLFTNFPEIMKLFVDKIIDDNEKIIREKVCETIDPEAKEKRKNIMNNVVIEIPMSLDELINQRINSIKTKLKEEIYAEIDRRKNINVLSDDQREEIKRIKELKIDCLSQCKFDEKNVDKDKINFYYLLKEITDKVVIRAYDEINTIYEKNEKDYFKASQYIINKLNKDKKVQNNFRVLNFADFSISKYRNPHFDKYVTRVWKIYFDLNKKSYRFLLKRYISQLNPKFNYYLILKIQNNKSRPDLDIKFDDLLSFVKTLDLLYELENGAIKLIIPRQIV